MAAIVECARLERRMMAERCCAHCQHQDVVCRGRANGLRRFHCLACGKTFNALTGTPLAHLHHKERWFDFAQSLSAREVVRRSAVRCAIATSTAFRWRHPFLQAIKTDASRLSSFVSDAAVTHSGLGPCCDGSWLWTSPRLPPHLTLRLLIR